MKINKLNNVGDKAGNFNRIRRLICLVGFSEPSCEPLEDISRLVLFDSLDRIIGFARDRDPERLLHDRFLYGLTCEGLDNELPIKQLDCEPLYLRVQFDVSWDDLSLEAKAFIRGFFHRDH